MEHQYSAKPRWSHAQTKFIADHYETMSDEQIAQALGRSLKAVRRKRERMLFKKASGRGLCEKFVDPDKKVPENLVEKLNKKILEENQLNSQNI